jgi:hypothetical protein
MANTVIVCPTCQHSFDSPRRWPAGQAECPRCRAKFTGSTRPRPSAAPVFLDPDRPASAAGRNLAICRDCGNPVSRSARACPRCGRVFQRSLASFALKALVVVPLLFFGSLYLMGWLLSDTPPRPTATPVPALAPAPATSPVADNTATLELPGGQGVWLATSDADWNDLLDAENAAAEGGPGAGAAIRLMGESGRARKYPNGTRVRILKASPLSRFVEVIDGDDRGRTGWVQAEFVRPGG